MCPYSRGSRFQSTVLTPPLRHLRSLCLTAVLALTACASGGKGGQDDDAGTGPGHDAGPGTIDAAPLPPDAAPQRPSGAASTSGGGTASSPNFRATITIGGPQPAGTTSSVDHEANVGAGASVP
jgi:hypothetical protein